MNLKPIWDVLWGIALVNIFALCLIHPMSIMGTGLLTALIAAHLFTITTGNSPLYVHELFIYLSLVLLREAVRTTVGTSMSFRNISFCVVGTFLIMKHATHIFLYDKEETVLSHITSIALSFVFLCCAVMLPHFEVFDAFFLFIFTIIGVSLMAWHVTNRKLYADLDKPKGDVWQVMEEKSSKELDKREDVWDDPKTNQEADIV